MSASNTFIPPVSDVTDEILDLFGDVDTSVRIYEYLGPSDLLEDQLYADPYEDTGDDYVYQGELLEDDPFSFDDISIEDIRNGLILAVDSMNDPSLTQSELDFTTMLPTAKIIKQPSPLRASPVFPIARSPEVDAVSLKLPNEDNLPTPQQEFDVAPMRIKPRIGIPRITPVAPPEPVSAPQPSSIPTFGQVRRRPTALIDGQAEEEGSYPSQPDPAPAATASAGRRRGGFTEVSDEDGEVYQQQGTQLAADPKGIKSAFALGPNESLVTGRFGRSMKEDETKGTWFGVFEYESDEGLVEAKISLTLAQRRSIGRGWFDAAGTWKDNIYQGRPDRILNIRGIMGALPKTALGAKAFLQALLRDSSCKTEVSEVDAWIEKYGVFCLYHAAANPDLVMELASPGQTGSLRTHWDRATQDIAAKVILENAGFAEVMIGKVMTAWGSSLMKQMKANPYELLRTEGVTFEDADRIAQVMNLGTADKRRVIGYVHSKTMTAEKGGSTAIDISELAGNSGNPQNIDLSGVKDLFVDRSLAAQAPVCLVHHGRPMIAGVTSYRNERSIAECIVHHLGREAPGRIKKVTREQVLEIASQVLPGKPLDPGQVAAVMNSANHPISFLTGGPGTGKSTVSKVLVGVLKFMGNEKIEVVAPVGRAARKAGEMSGIPGMTIHRRLGAKRPAPNAPTTFDFNENNRLPAGTNILADEFSMTDAQIGAAFLRALPEDDLRFVMIGDVNQLPPVGAGQVMVDLMAARNANGEPLIPTSQLTKIFRQDESGGIAIGAAKINAGIVPDIKKINDLSDIVDGGVGMAQAMPNSIWRHVTRLVQQVQQDGMDPMRDVFVLSAMRHGNGGTFQLNKVLSDMLNPNGRSFLNTDRYYDPRMAQAQVPRIGDRVMITENDMMLDIMNGDLGVIENADQKSIYIRMDDERIVQFPGQKWFSLILGYAGTIHKAQGSQYPVTIMAVSQGQEKMLERRLFYTGWTRAMNKLVIVGERSAVDFSIKTSKAYERTTMLTSIIQDLAAKNKPALRNMPRAPAMNFGQR